MGDLKGASALYFNLPLLSFYLYTTFKSAIAAYSVRALWSARLTNPIIRRHSVGP
jgi:hypothetical protein